MEGLWEEDDKMRKRNAVLEKALELACREERIENAHSDKRMDKQVAQEVARFIAEAEAELHPKGGQNGSGL